MTRASLHRWGRHIEMGDLCMWANVEFGRACCDDIGWILSILSSVHSGSRF
jgi:hypothetical protein